MNITQFNDFLNTYGLPTVIISAVISIIVFLIDRFFKDKLPYGISGYIPFILGIALFIIYDMIFNKSDFAISEESIYSGLVCGTIAGIVCAFFKTFPKDCSLSTGALAVYSVISEYVVENSAISLSSKIENAFYSQFENKEDELIESIALLLEENAKEQYLEYDFKGIAKLCVTTLKNVAEK